MFMYLCTNNLLVWSTTITSTATAKYFQTFISARLSLTILQRYHFGSYRFCALFMSGRQSTVHRPRPRPQESTFGAQGRAWRHGTKHWMRTHGCGQSTVDCGLFKQNSSLSNHHPQYKLINVHLSSPNQFFL